MLKKLARRILKKELQESQNLIDDYISAQRSNIEKIIKLASDNEHLENLVAEANSDLIWVEKKAEEIRQYSANRRKENEELKKIFVERSNAIFIPVSVFLEIMKDLPEPNKFSKGAYLPKQTNGGYSVRVGNYSQQIDYEISEEYDKYSGTREAVKVILGKSSESPFSFNVFLKRDKIRYNILGLDTEVDSCSWNFDFNKIALISDEAFIYLQDFIVTQVAVMEKINKE